MANIRRAGTRPEMVVRRLLHRLGYRYRVQWKHGAAGRLDIAFPGRRKAVLVHGCFWHRHEDCRLAYMPRTRQAFWADKFERNRARDARDLDAIARTDWTVLVIWECETRHAEGLAERLMMFLGPPAQ